MRIVIRFISVVLLAVSTHMPALAADTSCYPSEIPAPPIALQTVVLIDITTEIDPIVAREFRDSALAAARQPGQRLVVLTFAGLASGENLTKLLDVYIENFVTDPHVRANSRISAFKRSQACVRQRLDAAASALDGVLAQASQPPRANMLRSEIVHALRQTLAGFARPGLSTRVLTYGDGVQNGSGQVFYAGGQPRCIDPEVELQHLNRTGQAAPVRQPTGAVKVVWWGILVGAADNVRATRRYYSAECVERYRRFWDAALRGWGARDVVIGTPSPPNANLAFPALAVLR